MASVGSFSRRVTWTSGRAISEKPAPVRPACCSVESTIVSFIQLVDPGGDSMDWVMPLGSR